MSKLLIQEHPLQVLPTLATLIGLNEAIVVQQIHYWLSGKSGKMIDGRRWIYNGYKEWREQFPFWSDDTIVRAFKGAEKKGIILSRQEKSFNRKKWYSLDYDTLDSLCPSPQLAVMETASCGDGIPQNEVAKTPQVAVMLTEKETTQKTTQASAPKNGARGNGKVLKDPIIDLMARTEHAQKTGQDIISKFPESLRSLAGAFIAAYGRPLMNEIGKWKKDLYYLNEGGYLPSEILPAVQYAKTKGTDIKSPGSIVYALRALRSDESSVPENSILRTKVRASDG